MHTCPVDSLTPAKKGRKKLIVEPTETVPIPKKRAAPTDVEAPPKKKRGKKNVDPEVAQEVKEEPIKNKRVKKTPVGPAVTPPPVKEKKKRAPKVPVEPVGDTPKKKSRAKAAAKVEAPLIEDSEPAETPYPSPESESEGKKKQDHSSGQAPGFFTSYVQGVKEEQAQVEGQKRVPKKQVRIEAKEEAQERWKQPLVRSRVTQEVNDHMLRMYGMIFKGRQFK